MNKTQRRALIGAVIAIASSAALAAGDCCGDLGCCLQQLLACCLG